MKETCLFHYYTTASTYAALLTTQDSGVFVCCLCPRARYLPYSPTKVSFRFLLELFVPHFPLVSLVGPGMFQDASHAQRSMGGGEGRIVCMLRRSLCMQMLHISANQPMQRQRRGKCKLHTWAAMSVTVAHSSATSTPWPILLGQGVLVEIWL